MRTQPTLSPDISARMTEAMTLSPSSFRKRRATTDSLDLGYMAARHRALELVEGTTHSNFEVGQSSRSVPVQQIADETPTPRLPVGTTWEDPKDASLTIPTPVALPVPLAAVGDGDFLEIRVQLELHGSILYDHTKRLDAFPPTLFEGYDQDFTELFARPGALRDEIHSQCLRLRSL
nr:hypothetical protein [Tanacetum cinerariifolium]